MSLGTLESDIMRTCWAAGRPLTVREVLERLNPERKHALAYTTAMTVMNRLAEKGMLLRTARGRAYAYTPAAADEAALAVREVLREHGDAALAHFTEEASGNPEFRRRLQRLLEPPT